MTKMRQFKIFLFITCFILMSSSENAEDLYKLLGVPKDSSVKEIRKAFKTLAVKLHPDKNKDDKDADSKFIKIAQAYEILKDPETRKTYDIYGDTAGFNKGKTEYQSYSYYRDEFGIYDDDPLIATLSQADYELNVLDDNQAWFINFYSPQCHHCHELAPTWRKLAAEMEGVIRIAAVNCEEDWVLCHKLNINAYPTLLYYEKETHLYEGEQYKQTKQLYALKHFVLTKLTVTIQNITNDNWNDLKQQQWLLFICGEENECPEEETRLKLAAILDGLMPVGLITDPTLLQNDKSSKVGGTIFWQINEKANMVPPKLHDINGSDSKEIIDKILDLLPNPDMLDEDKFKDIRTSLRSGTEKPWLICFYLGTATELNLQLKRLPTIINNINIGLVHCGKSSALCGSLHVSHYPAWGVLKKGGAFELHHGRDVLHEVAAFARDSSKSTNLHAISPADFINIKNEGETWFIDWYAPWCPPCRRLMPEMRKASQRFDADKVQFGTVDCTLHPNLCSQEGIRSYPTTIFYNGTSLQQHFHGVLSEDGIVEFVDDMLYPSVIILDGSSFVQLMRKPEEELWIVDYFAPWCGPCQRLTAQWRILAKQMKQFPNIKVAQVDCVENPGLCQAQNIKSYPSIRMYPLESKGLNTVAMYNGDRSATAMKAWVLAFLPSRVESLTSFEFRNKILKRSSSKPWLVDFYAPWCSHCIHFEPDFRIVAEKLEAKVKAGKLDCEKERNFCIELRVTSYPTVILYLSEYDFHHILSQVPDQIVTQVENIINSKRRLHDEF